jgi:hypothetical protein
MTYKVGIIYRIEYNENPEIRYIGSTFNSLTYRWRDHKKHYKKYLNGKHGELAIYPYFKQYGIEKFTIIKIKEYQVCDRQHLEMYETLYINKMKCVNKCNPFSIKKLYMKQYNKENRDKILLQKKQYREANKEVINQKNKEYREANKEVITQYKKQYHEANKEILNQKSKEYRLSNKEVLNQKKKEKKQCPHCSNEITKNNFNRHIKKLH